MTLLRRFRNAAVVLGGLTLGAFVPLALRAEPEPPETIELPIGIEMCTSTGCIMTYGYSFVVQSYYYTYTTCNYVTEKCIYNWQH